MIVMSDLLYRSLKVDIGKREPQSPFFHSRFMGLNVRRSNLVPKRSSPIRPRTDDMRAMVEDLIARGEGEEQFEMREQAFIIGNFSA